MKISSLTVLSLFSSLSLAFSGNRDKNPNVLFILADDIGYGDLSCYGAKQIKTPVLDKLAKKGIRFTNAYAPAATSSPSRYALLTGEYAFRKGVSILPADAPLSIANTLYTLPQLFKDKNYVTGIVGKWHLGLGKKGEVVNFNNPIQDGPRAIGFDYAYYFPATNDRVPCVFIENDDVVGKEATDPIEISYFKKIGNLPTGKESPEKLKLMYHLGHNATIVNGVSRIGWMSGGKKALWKDEDMAEHLCNKVIDFIDSQSEKPFFLYYAPHNAHEPRIPSEQFKGVSKAGIYGDVIEEFDYYIGQIIKHLKKKNIFKNTLIVITSDNGPMVKEGYKDGALEYLNGHDPYANLRGEKYSLHEGGVRVPFIFSWPTYINKGFVQEQPFCYVDMLSTFSGLLDFPLADKDKKDSKDGSALFSKKEAQRYRDYVLVQNNQGNIALRIGKWKFIPSRKQHYAELYNLENDPSELHDLSMAYPEKVRFFNQLAHQVN